MDESLEGTMSVETTCLEITDDGHLRQTETDAAIERWRDGTGSFWIVCRGDGPTEVIDWLRTFAHDPALLEVVLERGHTAKFLPLEEAVYFETPTVTKAHPDRPFLSTFICLDRLVVQIEDSPAGHTESSDLATVSQMVTLREPSTSALICFLLVGQSTAVRRLTLTLRGEARRLATRMDDDPGSVAIDEIVTLKRRVRDVDETVDEQLAVFPLLKAVQGTPLDLVRLTDLYQVAITNTQSSDRAIDRLTRQAEDLQARYDLNQQDKTNRRLGVLTILSAIFLPLTLLAGIYGMNFDIMPELHFRYGYLAVLVAMALTAAGLFWYFWSRGWIGDTRRKDE